MSFNRVDLPVPLAPTMATRLSRSTPRSTLLQAQKRTAQQQHQNRSVRTRRYHTKASAHTLSQHCEAPDNILREGRRSASQMQPLHTSVGQSYLYKTLSGLYPKATLENCSTGGGSFPTFSKRSRTTLSVSTFSVSPPRTILSSVFSLL